MFRKEALENRDKTWCGKAVLLPGISSRLVIITSALFFVCFIVLISTGTYTRRISVQGEVTTWPRPVNVYSGVQGFVATQFVREGDPVKRVILFIKLMSVKVHVEAWSMRLNDRISKTN